MEAALQHLEEQGVEELDCVSGQVPGGILQEFVRQPDAILRALGEVFSRDESPGRPRTWRRIYSAMYLLNNLAEAEPAYASQAQRSVPSLRADLWRLANEFECQNDRRVTLMVRQKAKPLHQLLFGEPQGSHVAVSRELRTTDRLVAGLVRTHRDDASTESASSNPGSCYGEAADSSSGGVELERSTAVRVSSAIVPAGGEPASGTALATQGAASSSSRSASCLAVAFCGGALCAGTQSSKTARRSWGITPMACFFGMGERENQGQSGGSGSRASCHNACAGTPWVCAVLPSDSGSDCEREEGDNADRSAPAQTAAAAPSVASTSTPPPSSSPIQPPSLGGSETRSESCAWSEARSEVRSDVPSERRIGVDMCQSIVPVVASAP